MICPQCQQTIRDEARFCDSCGFSIGSLAASNQSPSALAETVKAVDPLIGHVIDSKYQIIEQLGKGGMGVVYRAERVLVGDEVALKILRGEFIAEEEAVERFRREARAAAKLRHPNIVTIHDYGEARGADAPAYIVMELLNGESLRGILKREGRLEAERAVTLMRGICAGIGLAHRRQIVHRDIKPDNIILLPPDEEEGREHETVKVVDFGIAKLRDAATGGTLTQKGFQPGTIYYMSPEQCRGDELDARSDVYSLGALLYEMLAGTPPFLAETQTGVIAKHLFDPPPPFPPDAHVPPALEAVVMRALAKDTEARPADAGALGRELQEAAQQEREAGERRADEERQRAEAEQRRLEEAQQREAETRRQAADEQRGREMEAQRRADEERRRASETLPGPTEAALRHEAGPKRQPLTDAALTQPALVKPALVDGANFGATESVSAASPGLDDAGVKQKRGARKVWIALGVLAALALVVGLIIKLYSSEPSTGTTQSTANSSAPSSSPGTVAPKIEVVLVPGGTFMMGSPSGAGDNDEQPQHRVTVQSFYMGKYEVTQAQYQAVMGSNPSSFKGDNLPVENVSWNDAKEFCRKLSQMTGKEYRLPTEAEWEYACRAGTTGDYAGNLDAMAWYSSNSGRQTHPVGQKQPNSFGLYDMHGNVWEWCEDWYHDSYNGAPTDGSAWLNGGEQKYRVLRGGSWVNVASLLRSAFRYWYGPGVRLNLFGLRVVAVSRS